MDSGEIIREVAGALNDPDHARWTQQDLIDYLNSGCMEVCRARPDANAQQVVLNLSQGTRQTIRPNDLSFIRAIRNVPSGRALRVIDSRALDAVLPMWHSAPRSDVIREYGFSPSEPRTFWVYPPARETAKLEVSVCVKPVPVAVPSGTTDDPFPLLDEYAEIVKSWMLYKAYAVDTGTGSVGKSQAQFRNFYVALGVSVPGGADE